MKKRGLIISSIVMMLVVVVALSTATYAWFAVSADAKISTLTVQTAASDGLQIAAVYKYDGSAISASSGTMSLTTGTRYWKGDAGDYGAELLFESALATAYGVTGDGRPQNMYTAASRTATKYVTTKIDDTYWGVGVTPRKDDPATPENEATEYADMKYAVDAPGALEAMTGVIYYTNADGTTPAAGSVFQLGAYAGTVENAYINLCGGDEEGANKGYYIRTQGFYTVKVTADNQGEFSAADTFYIDNAGITKATGGAFAEGVWTATLTSGEGEPETFATLWEDITASTLGTVYALAPVTTEITATNFSSFYKTGDPGVTDTVFYTDAAVTTLATGEGFTGGKFAGTDAEAATTYTGEAGGGIVGLFAERTLPADVETAWNYEANNSALTSDFNPRYLIPAKANSEYFQLNFALKTQRGMVANTEKQGVADIFIKKLAVTASGGMAAASRIALLEYTSNTFETPAANPVRYVFEPYSTSKYVSNWSVDETRHESYKLAPASKWFQGDGFAYKYAGESNFTADFTKVQDSPAGMNFDDKVIKYDETLINDGSVWTTATFFDIDKNNHWADKDRYDGAQAGDDATKKLCSVGTFTAASTVKYYQLAIWFEGTDTQCVTGYAGTGITVDLAFDFYQQWRVA